MPSGRSKVTNPLVVTPSTSFFDTGLTTGHFLRHSPVHADFIGHAESFLKR